MSKKYYSKEEAKRIDRVGVCARSAATKFCASRGRNAASVHAALR